MPSPGEYGALGGVGGGEVGVDAGGLGGGLHLIIMRALIYIEVEVPLCLYSQTQALY